MSPRDLERLIHEELRRLPLLRAPHTLLPRVLAAVEEWARRPWYRRAWFTWPQAGQIASLTALVAIVVGAMAFVPSAQRVAEHAVETFAGGLIASAAGVLTRAEIAASTARTVWAALVQPVALYALPFVSLMMLACVAFGAALNRVLFERALPR